MLCLTCARIIEHNHKFIYPPYQVGKLSIDVSLNNLGPSRSNVDAAREFKVSETCVHMHCLCAFA